MHIVKRGFLALSALALVGSTTGLIAATSASAGATRGYEVVRGIQYGVGNNNAVGPWNGRGVINTGGVVTDDNAATTGDLHTLVAPNGSFTVKTTEGNQGPFTVDPTTCAIHFTLTDVEVNIVYGTGIYRHATGHFDATVDVNGYLQQFPTGCDQNQNDPPAFTSTAVVAKGYIDLH
jgi:hypothetical protein